MVALETPMADIGWVAPDFSLTGINGKTYTLEDVKGPKGLLVMFICNHCPYVNAIIDRLEEDTRKLKELGIGCIAIMSNDTENYPDDSYNNMRLFALENNVTFPYVIDETQEVAKAYGAVCTPDFFGFDNMWRLQYRGRFDSSGAQGNPAADRELFKAMKEISEVGLPLSEQWPSVGCSIKWKE